ncbi:MAG: hypothetical protein AAGJ39_13500 [Pseudomonadota bacterium]
MSSDVQTYDDPIETYENILEHPETDRQPIAVAIDTGVKAAAITMLQCRKGRIAHMRVRKPDDAGLLRGKALGPVVGQGGKGQMPQRVRGERSVQWHRQAPLSVAVKVAGKGFGHAGGKVGLAIHKQVEAVGRCGGPVCTQGRAGARAARSPGGLAPFQAFVEGADISSSRDVVDEGAKIEKPRLSNVRPRTDTVEDWARKVGHGRVLASLPVRNWH